MGYIFDAHRQWRERPADERFATLKDMHAVTWARKQASHESRVRTSALRFEVEPSLHEDQGHGGEIVLRGNNVALVPSSWAMEQLALRYQVPGLAAMVAQQPAGLAASNLNWALARRPQEEAIMLWAEDPGAPAGIVRGWNSTRYARLWDHQVIEWARQITSDETNGWRRPPARTDDSYPSGYYSGDRDLFIFCANDANRIDDGSAQGLGRGFFMHQTEVNGIAFHFRTFLYEYVCGNHIVWGARDLMQIKIWHAGRDLPQRVAGKLYQAAQGYLGSSAEREQAVIGLARKSQAGKTIEEAVQFLMARPVQFAKVDAERIVKNIIVIGGDPTNLWDLVNSATFLSQTLFRHADQRYAYDAKAGRILDQVALKFE